MLFPNVALGYLTKGASIPAQLGQNSDATTNKQDSNLHLCFIIHSFAHTEGLIINQEKKGQTDHKAITRAGLQAFPQGIELRWRVVLKTYPQMQLNKGLLKTLGKAKALEEGTEGLLQQPFEALSKKGYICAWKRRGFPPKKKRLSIL